MKKIKRFNNLRQSPNKTIAGYETMRMIRKGQIKNLAKGNAIAEILFINNLFAPESERLTLVRTGSVGNAGAGVAEALAA